MRALRHRDFRLLWAGQGVSSIGDQLNVVAIAVFALQHGYGATGLGVLLAVRTIALLALLLVGGTIADRLPRRRVMLAADLLRGAGIVALALSPAGAPLLAVAPLAFAVGAGEALFRPAYQAVLPSLVPPADLVAANSVSAIARQSAAIAGPALAGILIAAFGVRTALLVDAATFAVSAATLLAVREPARPRSGRSPSVRREIAEGVAAVAARPWIAAIIAVAAVQLLFVIGPWQVLLPLIAREGLGGDSAYALLLSVLAAGALVGAIGAGRLRTTRPGVIALCALLPCALVPLALLGPAPLWVVAAAVALMGAGEQLFSVLWMTALQREVPDALLARVFALDYLGSFAFLPIGLALTGPAIAAVGVDAVLVAAAAVVAVTTLPLLAFPSVRFMSTRAPGGPGATIGAPRLGAPGRAGSTGDGHPAGG